MPFPHGSRVEQRADRGRREQDPDCYVEDRFHNIHILRNGVCRAHPRSATTYPIVKLITSSASVVIAYLQRGPRMSCRIALCAMFCLASASLNAQVATGTI